MSSPALQDALPGLAPALDGRAATAMLERAALLPGATVERCRPGKALYLGDAGCRLRYELVVRAADGRHETVLLLGRVLPDADAVARYQTAVALLADGLGDRLASGALRPWAVLPGNLVVHRFPVDPELPTLADAADPVVVSRAVNGSIEGLASAVVALGHYGRRDRCVLRYELGAETVYGKVWADDRGADVADVVTRLGGRIGPAVVPRVLAYVPELRLALLEALAGVPELAAALSGTGPAPASLVADAAAVAAALHTDGPALAITRTVDDELDELGGLLDLMRPVAPDLATAFEAILQDISDAAAATEALPLVPTHGDFTPSQLLRAEERCGLVDFDSMARAEAALDVGQYLAYLRLAAAKAAWPIDKTEELGRHFLAHYAGVVSGGAPDALAVRARVYGCISLFRTTAHAWQKCKPKRAAMVFGPLEREVACLPSRV
jgi:hypothetical protein